MTKARRLLLVCSPGGHLMQMWALHPALEGYERAWVTLAGADVEVLLRGERVIFGHGPTNRSIGKLIRNLPFAWKTVRRLRPDVIVSTGAGLAVPFFLVGRLHGCRLIYVESLTRINSLSLSGRLVYLLADGFFVQWPTTTKLRRARYVGAIL